MSKFNLGNKTARLIILQRIELASSILKKVRKLFGRYIFSNYITKFFLNKNSIEKKYYALMESEFQLLKEHLNFDNKNILSIGGGVGGLEVLIGRKFECSFTFIEKNYTSKKVKYGWDKDNKEAYNDLGLLKNFLLDNHISQNKFKIFDYDHDILPDEKFDIIISLYSLDYHYNFDIYSEYLKKISNNHTVLVFDTIKADFYKKIFHNVKVIKLDNQTVHTSKRIMCSNFI
ncbi:methyltransferase domain-containing protein [Candidatus Pelagibacter bacterium]|nr:methyltransferase domain-containing protein [Candidatus Pelagibacter bacterium]